MPTVGVFDSGVGGLSVLRALRAELPQVHFVYLADNAHAPYGERSPQVVLDRAHRLTEQLRVEHRIDALVVDISARPAHEGPALAAAMQARYLALPRADAKALHKAINASVREPA